MMTLFHELPLNGMVVKTDLDQTMKRMREGGKTKRFQVFKIPPRMNSAFAPGCLYQFNPFSADKTRDFPQ